MNIFPILQYGYDILELRTHYLGRDDLKFDNIMFEFDIPFKGNWCAWAKIDENFWLDAVLFREPTEKKAPRLFLGSNFYDRKLRRGQYVVNDGPWIPIIKYHLSNLKKQVEIELANSLTRSQQELKKQSHQFKSQFL